MQRRIWNPLTLSSVGLRAAMRCGRMLLLGDLRKLWAQVAQWRLSMLGARRWKDGVNHSSSDPGTAKPHRLASGQARARALEAFHVVR